MKIKTYDIVLHKPTVLGYCDTVLARFFCYNDQCVIMAKNAIAKMKRDHDFIGELRLEPGSVTVKTPQTFVISRCGNGYDIVKFSSMGEEKYNILFARVFEKPYTDTIQSVLGGTIEVGFNRPLWRKLS